MTVKIETTGRFVDYDLAFTQVGDAPDDNGVGGYSLAFKRDLNAISQSLQNLILTRPGEKPFIPDFGTNILNLMFDTLDPDTLGDIRDEVETAIQNYEPRVEFIDFVPDDTFIDQNNIIFNLIFRLVGEPEGASARTVIIEIVRAR